MRRQNLATAIGTVLLIIAAGWIAVRFRALPPAVDLRQMTWDAASHALIGLDLFDHIRRFEPLRLLLRLQEEHWWPPLFGVISLPAYVIGGRQLSSPSLVSLISYCLIPAFAFLSIRRVTTAVPLVAWSLVALLFFRSPQFIEMSTWSMLELVATLFAAASFYFFLAGPHSRARNWAYGLAGASALLKYHYGFFLLVTLGAATLMEMEGSELRAAGRYVWSHLRRRTVWIPALILAGAIIARRISETGDPNPWIPGVPNLIWIAYFITLMVMLIRRTRTKAIWETLPVPIRRFMSCGLIWPAVWFIDLANVQAWYRELRVTSDPPAQWSDQLRVIAKYLVNDYVLGPAILAVAVVGLVISIVEGARRRHVGLLALTFHAIWPAALMSFSKFLVESRFLSTVVMAFFVSAAAGWTLFLERRRTALRIAGGSALLGVLISEQAAATVDWEQQLVRRRVYCYASSDPPDQFVRATVTAFSQGLPVLIVLPPDIDVVAPTVRLGIRLDLADVPPHAVEVKSGGTARLVQRLRRFPGGLVGMETDSATLRRLVEKAGLEVVSEARGPLLPGHPERSLLIARVTRGE